MIIADLHIHSRYSRATSRECVPEYLELWARRKGIHLLGTGDFTHPAWRQELAEKLVPAEEGLYCLRKELRLPDSVGGEDLCPRFVVSGEISSIYKKNGKVRKVHNVILLPGLGEAEKLSEKLEAIGNIHSDGRPILGLDSRDLLEITLEVCPRAIFVPAHIWTPHFSLFGAFSGFDKVEECFEDLTPYIHAIETGLSSDPPMNWRLSALDRFQMISNSDAHSPAKLGREANLLDIPMSYEGLYGAIQEGKGLKGTIEFFPEEGKYHYDGHRKCHLCLSPREAEKYQGKCPVCGKKLTLGVSHRIEQLADREEGYIRPGAAAFESLVPLPEVIAASLGCSAASAKAQRQYGEMLAKLGTEFSILRERSLEEIQNKCGYQLGEGIRRLRQGKVRRFPGFDGEYGVIQLFEPSELEMMEGQMSLFGWEGMGLEGKKDWKRPVEAEPGKREESLGPGNAREEKGDESLGQRRAREEKETGSLGQKNSGQEKETGGLGTKQRGKGLDAAFSAGKTAEERKEAVIETQVTELNQEQLLAVRSVSPRIAVMAGPGTGKTRTLVFRILYLLQNRRVRPSEITAVTFTNQAAREMRCRLEERLGKRGGVKKLRIGTFHSLCYELLRASGREFTLAEEAMAREVAGEVAEELGIRESAKKLRQRISQRKREIAEKLGRTGAENGNRTVWKAVEGDLKEQETEVSETEKQRLTEWDGEEPSQEEPSQEELNQEELDQAVRRYQKKLTDLSFWDFDDLLIQALEMAEAGENPSFPYLLVDEFQDISPLQYRLIQAWSRGGREIFIIGDPDQAIYGFRGADSKDFLRFCQEADTEVISLRKNYRSTPEILRVSEKVLEKEEMLLESLQKPGFPVRLVQASGEKGEAIFIAKEINRLIGGIDMLDAQESFLPREDSGLRGFSDISVLYRTHRQAELLETCLKKEGIPYIVTGREDFLEEDVVRGSLAFFRSLINPGDSLSRRLCLRLLWKSGEESSCQVYSALAEKYGRLCGRGNPRKLWESWRKDMGLEENPAMGKLLSMAVFYKSMEEMLKILAFGREADLKRWGGKHYTSEAVNLMTIHGSKGLEFPVVFLYGLRAGILPLEYKGRETDFKEERRLLYVAMTRAKEELILTTSGEPSSFIKQVPEDVMVREKVRQENRYRNEGRQMSLFDL